jgi:hypothetical protein
VIQGVDLFSAWPCDYIYSNLNSTSQPFHYVFATHMACSSEVNSKSPWKYDEICTTSSLSVKDIPNLLKTVSRTSRSFYRLPCIQISISRSSLLTAVGVSLLLESVNIS